MRSVFAVSLVLVAAALPLPALAEEEAQVPTLHRDPKGQKGLNPFWEAVKKGDDAVQSKDLDGAKAAYRSAIDAEPNNPMGHYRLGEANVLKGDLKDAEASYQNALRLAADKPAIRAKVLFVLADLKERLHAFEDAVTSWNGYENHGRINRGPGIFPPVAAERRKRIADWTKLVSDYSSVKERIKRRLEEADKKSVESSRSPQNR